ncbi:hypothetical protein BDN70DRAFT_904613 [Pholiota conissans]|uniref:Uncharacterized protein n=1 Tax=Pholiota conissans TaxID=109636 RepID=A0A9P6CW88_9AGAR|nr:hypothetical protein BDN70DRAFT_904613 [Pholiota conissans]
MFDLVPAHQQLRAPIAVFDKEPTGALYLRQPHTVIELVEVAAPPPRRISSVINSSSAASSSYSSSSSSSSSFDDEEEMEVDEEEEEESVCSSYCSSDDYAPEPQAAQAFSLTSSDSGAFARRMKRILLWRENSEAPLSDSPLKRKLEEIEEPAADDDNVSHCSKRSRSQGSCMSTHSISSAELNMHPCPACDAFFPTLQSLRLHGQRGGNEACCVAVEYAFEQ